VDRSSAWRRAWLVCGAAGVAACNNSPAQQGADNIAAAWEKLTDQIGRDKQVALYKASLGM